jgi:hypothetical protein
MDRKAYFFQNNIVLCAIVSLNTEKKACSRLRRCSSVDRNRGQRIFPMPVIVSPYLQIADQLRNGNPFSSIRITFFVKRLINVPRTACCHQKI